MYTLRPYQAEMVAKAVQRLKHEVDRPFVLQAATGAGKSLIISDICHQLDEPVLILQPTKELLEQNYAKLQSYGITDISVYSASAGSKEIGKFTFATIGSIYRKPELFAHFRYILVDECDVVNPKAMEGMYQTFFDAIGCRNVCGLTATPYRMVPIYTWDNGNLYSSTSLKVINRIGKFWGPIAHKVETQELIDQGFLSSIRYRADSDDFHELVVNSTGADYTQDSLEAWGMRKVIRVADYCQWVDDKCQRNLVFCTSVAQTTKLQAELMGRGILAVVVTANTPPREREEAVAAFKSGEIRHLLNVGVFLAGFDVPELDCIIFARPTMSLRVWYQAVGRGVRLDPERSEKVLRVFDLGGALRRFGRVETIQLAKEEDGYRDKVISEVGTMTDRKLYSFKVPKKSRSTNAYH